MRKERSFLKKLKMVSLGASMADMALLLLVFFMATTTTEPPKGVEVEVPRAKTVGAEQDSIYISISGRGNYYFEGMEVSLEELKNRLLMRSGERDRTVAITADRYLDYRVVASLLEILQENEFLNIVFMSEPRDRGALLQ